MKPESEKMAERNTLCFPDLLDVTAIVSAAVVPLLLLQIGLQKICTFIGHFRLNTGGDWCKRYDMRAVIWYLTKIVMNRTPREQKNKRLLF